jgi:hypothetical protein
MIELLVKARHFRQAKFSDPCQCAVAHAANEYFSTQSSMEGVRELYASGKRYRHNRYEGDKFGRDEDMAEVLEYDETVLRIITLVQI